jgi:hypothetical protein
LSCKVKVDEYPEKEIVVVGYYDLKDYAAGLNIDLSLNAVVSTTHHAIGENVVRSSSVLDFKN